MRVSCPRFQQCRWREEQTWGTGSGGGTDTHNEGLQMQPEEEREIEDNAKVFRLDN